MGNFTYRTINSSIGRVQVLYVENDTRLRIEKGDWINVSVGVMPNIHEFNISFCQTAPFKIYGLSGAEYDVVRGVSNPTTTLFFYQGRTEGAWWKADQSSSWTIKVPVLVKNGDNYGYILVGLDVPRDNTSLVASSPNTLLWDNLSFAQNTENQLGFMSLQYVNDNQFRSGAVAQYPAEQQTALIDIIDGLQPIQPPSTDPYAPGGTSQPGGGGGSFGGNTNPASTDVTNNIDIPPLPPAAISAVNTGFITLFTPTTAELKNLADYMWSTSLFDLDTWQKLFANPMDALIGLSIVPVAVPSSGQSAVTVGNISTGVSMTKASSQYVSVNCGSIDFTEFWKGYLDYNPYTKVEIYLPYIGTRPISADDVMGKTVTVQYNIDVLSGACAAYIKCGESVLYNFVGQCSCSIPISGGDMTQVINGTLSIAASIGAMAETGGMSAATVGATLSTAANTIKTTVEKSGCISGMGGMLGIQTPYVIITRPRQALPENQNKFTGYPAFITATVGASAGYTEVEKVHLENIPATSEELAEIENLLKGGVII